MSDSALHNTPAAIGALKELRVMCFVGPDAATFLQGYVTCDTTTLAATQARPGAFCNLQGRVVSNGWLWGEPEAISFLTHHSCVAELAAFLKPYLNFSRTQLSTEEVAPQAAIGSAINRLSNPIELGSDRAVSSVFVTDTQATNENVSAVWFAEALRRREVWVSAAVSGKYLPQMLGLVDLGAVDFAKGCYLGQEVVARAEHRGTVKRGLRCARFSGQAAPLPGMRLLDEHEKEQGVVIGVGANPKRASDEPYSGLLAYVGKLSLSGDGAAASPNPRLHQFTIALDRSATESTSTSGPKIELDLY